MKHFDSGHHYTVSRGFRRRRSLWNQHKRVLCCVDRCGLQLRQCKHRSGTQAERLARWLPNAADGSRYTVCLL